MVLLIAKYKELKVQFDEMRINKIVVKEESQMELGSMTRVLEYESSINRHDSSRVYYS